MKKYIVSRHLSTVRRLLRAGINGEVIPHVDKYFLRKIEPGDEVYGNLPVNLIQEILIRGGSFYATVVKFSEAERLFFRPVEKNSSIFLYLVKRLKVQHVRMV